MKTGGIGFTGALMLLFIGLKLGGVINWSWFWVLFPITIPLTIALFAVIIAAITYGIDKITSRKRK